MALKGLAKILMALRELAQHIMKENRTENTNLFDQVNEKMRHNIEE